MKKRFTYLQRNEITITSMLGLNISGFAKSIFYFIYYMSFTNAWLSFDLALVTKSVVYMLMTEWKIQTLVTFLICHQFLCFSLKYYMRVKVTDICDKIVFRYIWIVIKICVFHFNNICYIQISISITLQIHSPGILFLNFALGDKG